MRTDGVFNINQVTIKCKPNDYITLVPFGDVHWDSPSHAKHEWDLFKESVRRYHNPVYLGMGDYLDSYSTSERRIIYSHDLHESTRSREEMDTELRVKAFAKEIGFMRGKLIGLMGGNHFPVFSNGTTGDQMLAGLLDTDYLGACCALRMTIEQPNTKTPSRCNLDIFAHHGRGGGATAGGRFNSVEKLQGVCEADIYLMGDNHARGALPLGDKLRLHGNGKAGLRLAVRKQWIGRTGSFLKGYDPGHANYVTDSAMPPSSLGWISFKLKFVRDRTGGSKSWSIDIRGEA